MTILLTGGAGFIGSHIADAMIDLGHTLIILDDLSSGNLDYINAQATFVEGDILDDVVNEIFEQHDIDVVIHTAAQKNVRSSIEDPLFDARVNILGSLSILEAARKAQCGKFIFVSTGGVYDETKPRPFTESTPIKPASPYLQSKYTIDHYLEYYHAVYGMQTLSLRLTNTFGPRQDPKGEAGVIAIFFEKLLAQEPVHIFGDGEQTRDFVYVADVVEAFKAALDSDYSGVLNIGTAYGVTINKLFELQATIAEVDTQPTHTPPIAGEVLHHTMGHDKATSVLGWKPTTTLEQGLKKTWEWYKQTMNS